MNQTSLITQIAEYLSLLKRGKYFVIFPVILSLIIGSAAAFMLPSIYRAEAKIFYLQAQIPEGMFVQSTNMYLETAIVFINSITFSRENILKIIKDLNLYPDLVDNVPEDDLIARMKDNYTQKSAYTEISDTAGKSQEVISGFELSFEHSDPQKAFRAIETISSRFIENYRMFREGFAAQSSSFFEDEKLRLKDEIIKIDDKISWFKKKNANRLPELFQSNYRILETMKNKLITIDEEIRLLKEKKILFESKLATASPFISMQGLSGQKILSPEEKLAALKTELETLLASYSEKHPDVIRSKREIKEFEKKVRERGKNSASAENAKDTFNQSLLIKGTVEEELAGAHNPAYASFKTQVEAIDLETKSLNNEKTKFEEEIQEYQHRVDSTPFVEKKYNGLIRELESAQSRYNELANQVLSLESSAAMEKRQMGGKLTLGQPPSLPLRPVNPNRQLIIAAALFLGTALGILLLLAWDSLYKTVRTSGDLLKIKAIDVLSEIPLIPSDHEKNADLFEPFKLLRTKIIPKTEKNDYRTILITSSFNNEGKTFIAVNLAVALARELDQTVLLVDANLNNPSLPNLFGIKAEKGLTDCLLYDSPLSKLLIRPGIENLVILPSGKNVSNSSELLRSKKMRGLIDEIKGRYEDRYILFDAPAMLTGVDTLVLSDYIDKVLFVIEHGRIPPQQVSEALNHLEEKKLLGAVFNKKCGGSILMNS